MKSWLGTNQPPAGQTQHPTPLRSYITLSNKLVSFKASDIAKRPGYTCDCELGSPKPGLVKLDPTLHYTTCIIYRRLTSGEYTEDVRYFYDY
jgi:hypothetical protein